MSEGIWPRTAPCLLQDLLFYNFQGHFRDIFIPGLRNSTCQPHLYTTNEDRTFLPRHGGEPRGSPTAWTLALTCVSCRCHVDIKIEFGASQLACPSQEFPLHHFCLIPSPVEASDIFPRTYTFQCSFSKCQATICAILRLPDLQHQEILYMTDVKTRMSLVLERLPKTKNRNPLEALDVFRTYIKDSLWNSQRAIPADNGAFESCLGDGARKMLLRLGFSLEQENGKPVWKLPQPLSHDKLNAAFDLGRCALEDVREELTALIQGRPETEKRGNTADMYPPPPGGGTRDLEQLLGASNYAKTQQPNHWDQAANLESYSGLGALPDFADALISFAYEQQCRIVNSQIPYFFRCLKGVAERRSSEGLSTQAATLESRGCRTDIEIAEAFRALGIDMSHANFLNDENILSKYRSRLQDCGKEEQQRMQQALAIVGDYMQSSKLRDVAQGTLETYEQALSYLGAEDTTSDEWLISLRAAKEQEALVDKSTVVKALEIIADHRKSGILKAHLQGEDPTVPKMDLHTAYSIFEASETADSDTLMFAFPELLHKSPERRDEIIRAMKAIAESRGNNELLQQAQSALQSYGNQALVPVNPLSYPRGLENIGNTCYLNSFLQYLYTIKELRDLVQNIGEHEQDASEDALLLKKVSDERITKHQVLRAQNFVHELNKLFEALRTSHSGAVTLDKRLAALTVAPTGDWSAFREQEKRRRSTMVSPKSPKVSLVTNLAANQTGLPSSADSGTVFVESPREELTSARSINEVFSKDNSELEWSIPETEEDPNKIEPWPSLPYGVQSDNDILLEEKELVNVDPFNVEPVAEPEETKPPAYSESDPPPVPPRQDVEESKNFNNTSTEKIEEWARQQDMREALANVFRQLRWAIKGDDVNSKGGEQVDLISSLFYGKENVVTLKEGGEEVTETIPFHSLFVIPDESYESIYGMLDGAYGFREITNESSMDRISQYSTFDNLPPVLHIDVAVTAWDKEAQHAVRRAPFKVAETFYMDRYLDNASSIEKRKRVSALMSGLEISKEARTRLTKSELELDAPNTLRSTNIYLETLLERADQTGFDKNLVTETLARNLTELEDEISTQLRHIDDEISRASNELSALFPEEGQWLYRLHAVCMHTGRADSGHYFIYIYDSASRSWYKYNDETVELVENTRPILDPNGGISDGIPAMLVYVREPQGEGIMQTVCREPEELPQEPTLIVTDVESNTTTIVTRPDWDEGRPVSLDEQVNW